MSKENVCETYDKISDWYECHRFQGLFEKPYLDKIIENIKPSSSFLDLGCGTGEPIARYLFKNNLRVIGVDGSKEQIKKARNNLPELCFIQEDMRKISFEERFDCIIAWHSFFHLPQSDQRKMFSVFKKHIKPSGFLLFTTGEKDGEVWSENGGEMLFHASLATKKYNSLLQQYNFEIICHTVRDKNCGDATVWLARQKNI